ncbi:glutamine--fructose-6-phosphate transaminase (isomerizing) [Liberiplasma polymorphum]|jgi:glutamine---fructose-6-phosphate transaminase (isomerizing)|uniref:glutamine--fructose-6-phosphate transaminase (isomerizing) n=1 Tax=Liberiplasma polymorphum TaxID=3374570 RepID=UPI003775FAE0
MCGIVGYIGQKNAKDIIINGLSRLEYRGYDSAGISLYNHDTKQYELFKDKGRVAHLNTLINQTGISHSGIGHTRWATHGMVNQENAHPHFSASNRFMIVHNGVIENFHHLREDYLKGHEFVSETDTEVIVQLIELFAKTVSVEEAILKTLKLLKGSYAILAVDQLNPNRMYAAKNKSPMIIGKGKDDYIIASDLMAMVGVCTEYLPLEDHSFAIIENNNLLLYSLEFLEVKPSFMVMDFEDIVSELGVYPHYMLKEIMEQPAVIRNIVSKYFDEDTIQIDENIIKALKKAKRIHMLAAGTSMHAGYIGKIMFERLVKKPVEVHIASEFAYYPPVIDKDDFFILLSQSGETADLRACLQYLTAHQYQTLTITNVKTSTLAREAKYFLEIFAGPEIAVASTKAYTAQSAVLALLAYKLEAQSFNLRQELSKLSQAMDSFLAQYETLHPIVTNLLQKRNCFYIGRGMDYFVCLEAALKLKEISYIQTEGFAAGELKHGTIALIEDGTPVIALISEEKIALNTRSNLKEVESRGANTLKIVTESLAEDGDHIILPNVHPILASLLMVLPTQVIAYYAALDRNLDIDKPRNLAKSVTVE